MIDILQAMALGIGLGVLTMPLFMLVYFYVPLIGALGVWTFANGRTRAERLQGFAGIAALTALTVGAYLTLSHFDLW